MSKTNATGLPSGVFFHHGDFSEICMPTKWADVVTFLVGNYVIHAATIVSSPGSSLAETVLCTLFALFAPVMGCRKGFTAILSFAKSEETDLQVAAKAGALCKVVRVERDGEIIQARSYEEAMLETRHWLFGAKVHGSFAHLPDGYGLAFVAKNSRFIEDSDSKSSVRLSSSWNVVSILASIAQALFAATTLYRAIGHQVQWYGYAAFGLTVTQYAWMSLVNLVANFCCPKFSAVYLVRSPEMTEAESQGAIFSGVVGELQPGDSAEKRDKLRRDPQQVLGPYARLVTRPSFENILQLLLMLSPLAVSVVVNYSFTRFDGHFSDKQQRQYTLLWLLGGNIMGMLGWILSFHHLEADGAYDISPLYLYWLYGARMIQLVGIGIPFAYGMSAVIQMYLGYGRCTDVVQ